jgi:membrane-bound serine protease (ClpP class)
MDSWITLGVVYAAGIVLLLGDFFLPSHGVLTLASFAVLGYGLYATFQISTEAGLTGSGLLLVGIPTVLRFAVKHWHRTWVGRKISPPNPVLTDSDRLPIERLKALIGQSGRTMTPLRPVGMCLFDDQRVECMSEQGMIAAGAEVECIRLSDRTLVVRPVRVGEQRGTV